MSKKKIGTFYGVLVPNITMMLGVILFLRLSAIVGHAGIFRMLAVIAASLGFMLITSLSIASIATNMRMGGGGVYYLITRSLGIEIGGAVGLALYLSQIISITLTITGFAYIFCDLFPQFSIPYVEAGTLTALGLVSSFSSKEALKLQVGILTILLIGVASIFFGSMEYVPAQKNLTPLFEGGSLTFWQTFAFFFPAMTGIEAGMAMSGILKKPGRSLYIGNIGALLFVALLYGGLSLYADLKIPEYMLAANPFIFVEYAYSSNLVAAGILMATLSSALGSILGAPRIFESMAKDGLAPSIFGKVYGKYNEPRWSLWLTVTLALIMALSTNIDQIIPILTMICLITYGLLNLVAGLAELMNTASWRPTIRTPWWLSILGCLSAIGFMLFINVGWTFMALFLFALFFIVIQGRNIKVGFRDIRESLIFFFSRAALYHLSTPAEHALVWHPQLLVIATGLSQQKKLAFLSHYLTQRSGVLTFSAIVPESWQDPEQIQNSKSSMQSLLEKENIGGLVEVIPAETQLDGQLNLIRAYGIGPIQPNSVVLPLIHEEAEIDNLLTIMDSCRLMQKNLVLFRDSSSVKEELYASDEKKRVDLWWNGDDRNGFDLAVSLVTTLRDSRLWADSAYNLQAIVSSRSAAKVIQKFFKDFIRSSRLPFAPVVHLEPKIGSTLSNICKYSEEADLTVICIRALHEEEDMMRYREYLQNMFEKTENLKDCLFIACYDNIEHKEIYQYPTY